MSAHSVNSKLANELTHAGPVTADNPRFLDKLRRPTGVGSSDFLRDVHPLADHFRPYSPKRQPRLAMSLRREFNREPRQIHEKKSASSAGYLSATKFNRR